MIYDCFSFFNELDLLEIRLNTLDKVVDKFVLVEAPWTHTGRPKPLYYAENRRRFAPFLDKIVHVVASDPPTSPSATDRENAWIRENWQRNEIARGLSKASPDDVIIISDADEIPRPEIIHTLAGTRLCHDRILNLNTMCYAFFLNNRCVSTPSWLGGPQMLTYANFVNKESYSHCLFSECCPRCANQIPSATLVRFMPNKTTIKDAGWHFSSMGGIKAIQTKILSFAHSEFADIANDPAYIEATIKSGQGFFGFGDRYMPEPLENDFPVFVVKNRWRFSNLILPADAHTWKSLRWKRLWFRIRKEIHDKATGTIIKLTPKTLHPFMRRIRETVGL